IASKRAFAVMTGATTLPATSRVMVQRLRRAYLAALRHPRSNLMTFVAGNFLMLRMIETDPEGGGGFGRSRITAQLMARPAGRDVAATGLGAWSMAPKTGCVRIESRRY